MPSRRPSRASYRRVRARATYSSASPPPRPATSRRTASNRSSATHPPGEVGDQRDLVAVGELRALQAIGPDLVGELGLVHPVETEPLEELRLVREREHARDPQHDRLGDARLHQLRADPAAHPPLLHGEGPHLREVLPHDVDGGGADHLPAVLVHEVVPQVLVDVAEGPREHVPLAGVVGDQFLDRLDVRHPRLPDHPPAALSISSFACAFARAVISAPEIIRASSLILSCFVRGFTPVATVPPAARFTTWRCCSAKAATCGRCVTQTTWETAARLFSRAPTRSATLPPIPVSISSNTSVRPPPPREAALRSDSITRESSPPEAVAASGRVSWPGFAENSNSASSNPEAERDPGTASRETTSARNLAPSRATFSSSASTADPIAAAAFRRRSESFFAARTASSSSRRSSTRTRFSSSRAPARASRSIRISPRWETSSATSFPYFLFRRRISLSRASTRSRRSGSSVAFPAREASSRESSITSSRKDRSLSAAPDRRGSTDAASRSRESANAIEAFRCRASSAASPSSSPGASAAFESSPISKSRVSDRLRAPAPRPAASSACRRSAATLRYRRRIPAASGPVHAKSSIDASAAARDSSSGTLCCPTIVSSIGERDARTGWATGRPFRYARLRPAAGRTRRRTASSSHGSPASSQASRSSSRRERSKSADTSASASPVRTAIGSAFSPRASRIASTSTDFPAPVSPVTTFSPPAKATRTSSKMARFRTASSISIAGVRSPLSPLQLRAQDGEVIPEGRTEEPEGRLRLPHLDHVPLPQAEPDLAVEGEEDVGLLRAQLGPHHQVVRHHEGAERQGVRADGGDQDRAQRGVDDRPLRRQGVAGGAGGRRDDQAVRLEGGEVRFADRRLDVDDLCEGPLVDHHVVQDRVVRHPFPEAVYVGDQHHPLVVVEVVREDPLEDRVQFVQGDGGHEAEGAEVYAEDRLPRHPHHAGRGQERPVPADHDQEVALFRHFRPDDGVRSPDQCSGLPVEDHAFPMRVQPLAQLGNDGLGPRVGVLCDDPGALHRGSG